LKKKTESDGLRNIHCINTSGKINTTLDDKSIDIILLYDIFIYFSIYQDKLPKLLREMYRVSKFNALISIYPKHTDSDLLKDIIENAGFQFKKVYSGILLHESNLERGEVLNFIKPFPIKKKKENLN
jgi:DNA modification methylase